MKTCLSVTVCLLGVSLFVGTVDSRAATAAAPVPKAAPVLPAAVHKELDASLAKGVAYLLARQQPNGSWMGHPAVTALVALAIARAPGGDQGPAAAAVDKGLTFVVGSAKADGSIWSSEAEDYPNYSTAVSLITLATVNRPQDAAVIRAAREFLLDSQFREDVPAESKAQEVLAPQGKPSAAVLQVPKSDPAYGGIGYGKAKRPDLSNTQWALEALALTDHLDREPFSRDPAKSKQADLAWDRARQFLSRCQNLPATNQAVWVATDPDNRGGFVYRPGASNAGEDEVDGKTALRSYGSMTYAGLKSMIYARLQRDDPRVQAAVDWIRRHYTFEDNPGLGAAGLYYYLHTCVKALAVLGEESFADAGGHKHAWREEFISRLVQRQKPDGSWLNGDSSRWWESQTDLVTAYALISLEIAAGLDSAPGTL